VFVYIYNGLDAMGCDWDAIGMHKHKPAQHSIIPSSVELVRRRVRVPSTTLLFFFIIYF
jgi:hypothetical protein